MNAEEFKRALLAYKEACSEHLEQGRKLFDQIERKDFDAHIEKPFLLKMVFEKYLDLLEGRLIPAMQVGGAQQDAPAESAKDETAAPPVSFNRTPQRNRPANRIDDALSAKATRTPAAESTPSIQETLPTRPVLMEDRTEGASRRMIPRYTQRMPVHYTVLGRDTEMITAFSRDVGARGLFIMSNRPEKVGNALNIEVNIPDLGRARIQAVVAWTKWVPQTLRSVDCSGFGVKINTATENWYRYFMEIESDGAVGS